MIYELRTYTVRPGTLGDMVKAASTVSSDIRKNDYGKLEGYWFTEIGPLNQVMHMWSYPSYDERTRLRGELAKNPRWNNEYIPLIRPIVLRQDIRLLNAIRPPVAPATSGFLSQPDIAIRATRQAAVSFNVRLRFGGITHSGHPRGRCD